MAIYECEKTYERIFLGALFGPHAPHFIAGWRSDFQDQVRLVERPYSWPRGIDTHVCPLFAARECPGYGLLSEARHTRTAHIARLDSALRAGATAQVSPQPGSHPVLTFSPFPHFPLFTAWLSCVALFCCLERFSH